MNAKLPQWLDPGQLNDVASKAGDSDVLAALASSPAGIREFAVLLSYSATPFLEQMAVNARALTLKHFGRTISLYVPLYLSNYCTSGCAYCGFASDRNQPRHRLEPPQILAEMEALKQQGFEDVLLLTGEETPEADFKYLLDAVAQASKYFHNITVESFAMTEEQYRLLAENGCTGITLYQETYDIERYDSLHRWGPKKDFMFRLEAPERALRAGMRTIGLGVLLGLSDPVFDSLCLYNHAKRLQKEFWDSGISISFPRICNEVGSFVPTHTVSEKYLSQLIFAFRICLPDTPLVLSTRESPQFRDGMAGLGINRMSAASRTTVGGYAAASGDSGQFEVNDTRDTTTICQMLKEKNLFPVFKNWDETFQKKAEGCQPQADPPPAEN
jgi:2-iminoacetate synthase